jgi:DNA polymerase III subunit alpha
LEGGNVSRWFNAHCHSEFSVLDGMAKVPLIVQKVAEMGQPAASLLDHGTMAGAVQLYQSARKYGVIPFIGVEAYLLDPQSTIELGDKGSDKIERFHLGLHALNLNGYQGLMRAVNKSHTRPRFSRFPRMTLDDLTDLSEECGDDIALLTGCYFGYVQQSLVNDGPKKAANITRMYASLFPNTFVEIQHHNICHDDNPSRPNPMEDDEIVAHMIDIADELGLPVIATQDSHYLDQNDKIAHELMKRMSYGGTDPEFPGDSFHVASDEWVAEHYSEDVWDRVEEGCDALLDLNELTIPALDTFKVHVPSLTKNPLAEIKRICMEFLADYPPYKRSPAKFEDRLLTEFTVIAKLDIAGYFMLVRNYVEWCAGKGICIEARGSANASLACFCLGITQVDPLEWGLDDNAFSRFLSLDRIKPPDIDMDVEDVARDRLIGYLLRTFDSMQIGTFSKLGEREDGKGSVLVSYQSYLARGIKEQYAEIRKAAKTTAEKKAIDARMKSEVSAMYARTGTVSGVRQHYPDDYPALKRLGNMGGVYKSYGVHAGGVLLSGDDQRIDDYVPRMLVASSDTSVSQFAMDDVENLGFLKLDILGQTSLTVMRKCQEMIGREDPTDFTWIPKNDAAACKILREGRRDNGVFHFEAPAKSRGGRELGIKSTMDAILGTALYMPGPKDSGQTELYITRRRDPELRAKVTYLHKAFEVALKDTHGAVVYQEQVVQIMRGLGMSIASINTLFKIVKDSGEGAVERNAKRLGEIRAEFDGLCKQAGLTKAQTETAWQSTAGFAAYGFNKAHSAGYGIRSYRTAYLKAHYPLEYMTALLQAWAGKDKETIYIREARRIRIRILPPDIQSGGATWVMDRKRNAILRPMVSIKGIGPGAAESLAVNAPYESLEDLIERTDSRAVTGGKNWAKDGTLNGVLAILRDAGALRSLGIEKGDGRVQSD